MYLEKTMYFLAPMVVVFIGAWGLYNTTEVFPKAEYDLVVNPTTVAAVAVAGTGPGVGRGAIAQFQALGRLQSRMRPVEERLRTAVAQGRMSEGEAQQEYDRAAQVAVSEI